MLICQNIASFRCEVDKLRVFPFDKSCSTAACPCTYTNFASSQAVHKSLSLKQQIPPLTARASRKCQFKQQLQRKIVIVAINTGSAQLGGICPCHSSWVVRPHGQRYVRTKWGHGIELETFSTNTRNEWCTCTGNNRDFCKAGLCLVSYVSIVSLTDVFSNLF